MSMTTAMTDLPGDVAEACGPVFAALPLEDAMAALVGEPGRSPAFDAVASAVQHRAVATRPGLVAGLWLYIDELDRSHTVSQNMHTSTGSYWHAIMHRREGDFSNSKYWLRMAGSHPTWELLRDFGYEPYAYVDNVARAIKETLPTQALRHLQLLQRQEWATLFAWCAASVE